MHLKYGSDRTGFLCGRHTDVNLRETARIVGHVISDVSDPVAAVVFTRNVVGSSTFKDDLGLRLLGDAVGKDGTHQDAKEKNELSVFVPKH